MDVIGAPELRIALFGKTGKGKSATGNTILGRDIFNSDMSSSSVTKHCQLGTACIGEQNISVVDTPDFFYSTHTENLDSEIRKSIALCGSGPHVLLYVLKLETFTEQEADGVSVFQKCFGEAADKYTTIVFTHGDKLDGANIEQFVENNKLLLDSSDQRHPILNNKDRENRLQVTELLEKINRMVTENGGSCFTLEMLDEAERKAEEEMKMLQEERCREKERKREEYQRELKRIESETEEGVRKDLQIQMLEKEDNTKKELEETERRQLVQGLDSENQKNFKTWFDGVIIAAVLSVVVVIVFLIL